VSRFSRVQSYGAVTTDRDARRLPTSRTVKQLLTCVDGDEGVVDALLFVLGWGLRRARPAPQTDRHMLNSRLNAWTTQPFPACTSAV